jgi:hypothetical protein
LADKALHNGTLQAAHTYPGLLDCQEISTEPIRASLPAFCLQRASKPLVRGNAPDVSESIRDYVQQGYQTTPPLQVQQFAARVRAKYPEYAHVDDATLARAVVKKYPEYADKLPKGFVLQAEQLPLASVLEQTRKDKAFMAASAADQMAYIAYIDPSFTKLSQLDQRIYLANIMGQASRIRSVRIPASLLKWLRSEAVGTEWDADTMDFQVESSDDDILHAFQAKLRPKPRFSVGDSLSLHRLPSYVGALLLAAGLCGLLYGRSSARKLAAGYRP